MKRLAATFAVAVALVASACTSNDKGASPSSTPVAHRIISLSPTATEMLFAVGADKQVVAVDADSDYPAKAPHTKLSGFEPNVEAISAYKPDLVVIADDVKNLKAQLTALKIPVLVSPTAASLDDTYREINEIGKRTGHVDKATGVVKHMQDRIAALRKELPTRTTPLTYYHELDNTLFSATSKTFIGNVYALAGLKNIADPADPTNANGGYPQLTAEFVVKADPDIVFLADTKCCSQNATTFGARPGFGVLKAVQNHHVIALDDSVASHWGPRIVDFFTQVVAVVKGMPQS